MNEGRKESEPCFGRDCTAWVFQNCCSQAKQSRGQEPRCSRCNLTQRCVYGVRGDKFVDLLGSHCFPGSAFISWSPDRSVASGWSPYPHLACVYVTHPSPLPFPSGQALLSPPSVCLSYLSCSHFTRSNFEDLFRFFFSRKKGKGKKKKKAGCR